MKKEIKGTQKLRTIVSEVEKTNRLLAAILRFLVKYYTPTQTDEERSGGINN